MERIYSLLPLFLCYYENPAIQTCPGTREGIQRALKPENRKKEIEIVKLYYSSYNEHSLFCMNL
ncbi:MAG: hypothetical protein PQJ58_15870 [Spirochaetales bacterium]|nr:hypothetical protein [Spirochaetales bacterium]